MATFLPFFRVALIVLAHNLWKTTPRIEAIEIRTFLGQGKRNGDG